ncbi:MAG: LysM peptidoglycan-binding domain-containing protein [Chitinophagaceae bacterium]|nr:LysM peptidoglycan-binding domain-containing protein [Chitinophagaceae bacterium]
MKKFICLLFLAPLFVFAQDKIINHTVAPKESYSSIGRLYNINGRELANYNNLDYEKGLSIGQVLKVPVKNAAAVGNIPAIAKKEEPVKQTVAKNGEPTYHTVAPKQTLYGVSKLYNITIADIKNGITLQ